MSTASNFFKTLNQFAVTAPGVSYFTGPKEVARRAIANLINTLEGTNPGLPVISTLRQYLAGPIRRVWADGKVSGRGLGRQWDTGYKAIRNTPKNWRQHVLAWGMNSPDFRAYDNIFLESLRKISGAIIHVTETLTPLMTQYLPAGLPAGVTTDAQIIGPVFTPLRGAIGLSTGSAAQATKQALYHRAGLGKI
jgi:hypothetical protein